MQEYWVRACKNNECWMSANVSSLTVALLAAAEWFLLDNVNTVEVERRERHIDPVLENAMYNPVGKQFER